MDRVDSILAIGKVIVGVYGLWALVVMLTVGSLKTINVNSWHGWLYHLTMWGSRPIESHYDSCDYECVLLVAPFRIFGYLVVFILVLCLWGVAILVILFNHWIIDPLIFGQILLLRWKDSQTYFSNVMNFYDLSKEEKPFWASRRKRFSRIPPIILIVLAWELLRLVTGTMTALEAYTIIGLFALSIVACAVFLLARRQKISKEAWTLTFDKQQVKTAWLVLKNRFCRQIPRSTNSLS